jgi:site-specific DNA-methyltransferase (adenine-specific)
MNKLFYGDNLDVLRRHVDDDSVDLVYLDPPFKSNQDYNVLFREHDGAKAAAQILAFEDTWEWNEIAEQSCQQIIEAGGKPSEAMRAFRTLLGTSDMMAYLAMMAPRMIELRKVMRSSGSIYLHCDPTASHYLKLLMDAVFGPENFRSEIIWRRTGSHNSAKRYGPIHDTILFYVKDYQRYFFKTTYRPYLKGHVESYFKNIDEKGRYWTNALTGAGTRNGKSGLPWHEYNPTEVGRHWAIPGKITEELGIDPGLTPQEKLDLFDKAGFIDHPQPGSKAMPTYRQYLKDSPGMALQDIFAYQPHTRGCVWESDEGIDEDVRWLVNQGDAERLGYPTQKPQGLLERLINSSSKPGELVLDPFCGCGTAIEAAEKLERQWIGIDITHLSVALIKHRLQHAFGDSIREDYEVIGEPVSLPDAEVLAAENQYQFQYWALGLVGARPNPYIG